VILTRPIRDQFVTWYGWAIDCVIGEVSGEARAIVKKINFIAVYVDMELPMSCEKYTKALTLRHNFLMKFELPESAESQLIDYWQRRLHATLDDWQQLIRYNIRKG
jgi:hypothetical protein